MKSATTMEQDTGVDALRALGRFAPVARNPLCGRGFSQAHIIHQKKKHPQGVFKHLRL